MQQLEFKKELAKLRKELADAKTTNPSTPAAQNRVAVTPRAKTAKDSQDEEEAEFDENAQQDEKMAEDGWSNSDLEDDADDVVFMGTQKYEV